MAVFSKEANQRIAAAINYMADRASPCPPPDDWMGATKNLCMFIVFAVPTVEITHWTGSVMPGFMFGWAWGALGIYGIMRKRP